MGRMAIAAVGAVLILAGCAERRAAEEAEARAAATQTAVQVISKQYPIGFPAVPAAECVADNASEVETFRLVEAQLKGITGTTTQSVVGILQRQETLDCLRAKGIPAPV